MRLTEPAYEFPKSTGRISIVQQQHIKTIIVDDKYVYLGSANFDSATFAGAFREMSIEVNEPQVAKKSSTIFDRLWNDKREATTNDLFEKMKASEIKSPSFESKFIGLLETEGKRIKALNAENIDPGECN